MRLVVPALGDASLVHAVDSNDQRGALSLVASASLGPHPVEWWGRGAHHAAGGPPRAIRRAAAEIGSTATKRSSRATSDYQDVAYLIVPVRARGRT